MNKISIIIPAYNEENSILSVLSKVKETIKRLDNVCEIIVVNDGSVDDTKNLIEKQDNVLVINHPYKKGYGASLKHGVKKASGNFVLFIDADGQQNPDDILRIIKYIPEYDMVIGARTNITSLSRALAKKILCILANYLSEYKIPDLNSGFRIVKKEIFSEYLDILPNSFSLSSTITLACLKDGYNVKFIPIIEEPRKSGKSTIHPIKDFLRFSMLILRLTVLFSPFRIFLPVSIFLFSTGTIYILFYIVKFSDIPDTGIFLILSSLIIFFFGLIADQIAYIRRKI